MCVYTFQWHIGRMQPVRINWHKCGKRAMCNWWSANIKISPSRWKLHGRWEVYGFPHRTQFKYSCAFAIRSSDLFLCKCSCFWALWMDREPAVLAVTACNRYYFDSNAFSVSTEAFRVDEYTVYSRRCVLFVSKKMEKLTHELRSACATRMPCAWLKPQSFSE